MNPLTYCSTVDVMWLVTLAQQGTTRAANAPSSHDAITRILWLSGLLVLGVLVVVTVAVWFRRRWLSSSGQGTSTGFTLREMRRLHEEGQITDEEFEAARTALLARTRHEAGAGGSGEAGGSGGGGGSFREKPDADGKASENRPE